MLTFLLRESFNINFNLEIYKTKRFAIYNSTKVVLFAVINLRNNLWTNTEKILTLFFYLNFLEFFMSFRYNKL